MFPAASPTPSKWRTLPGAAVDPPPENEEPTPSGSGWFRPLRGGHCDNGSCLPRSAGEAIRFPPPALSFPLPTLRWTTASRGAFARAVSIARVLGLDWPWIFTLAFQVKGEFDEAASRNELRRKASKPQASDGPRSLTPSAARSSSRSRPARTRSPTLPRRSRSPIPVQLSPAARDMSQADDLEEELHQVQTKEP